MDLVINLLEVESLSNLIKEESEEQCNPQYLVKLCKLVSLEQNTGVKKIVIHF